MQKYPHAAFIHCWRQIPRSGAAGDDPVHWRTQLHGGGRCARANARGYSRGSWWRSQATRILSCDIHVPSAVGIHPPVGIIVFAAVVLAACMTGPSTSSPAETGD